MLTIHRYSVHLDALPIIIEGMRNSWESWEKGDSFYEPHPVLDSVPERYVIGPNDLALCKRLIKAGPSHGKFMRQIGVVVDITAPDYWWREQATYKIGTVENSTSTMHMLGKREITADMFSFDNPDATDVQVMLFELNALREKWVAAGRPKPSAEWRKLVQALPSGFNYLRTCSLNYEVLRGMYDLRRNHKLGEWRTFCEWVETLPYSELITFDRNEAYRKEIEDLKAQIAELTRRIKLEGESDATNPLPASQ